MRSARCKSAVTTPSPTVSVVKNVFRMAAAQPVT